MAENLDAMKLDMSGLIVNWGKRCTVQRKSATLTGAGRYSGSYAVVASGTFVIEPVRANSRRQEAGLLTDTTHLVYGRFNATLQAEDRLYASGVTYFYDVLGQENEPQHVRLQVKQVARS